MNFLFKYALITLIAVPTWARTPNVEEQREEVRANLETLLKSVEGLTPVEVKDILSTQEGQDTLYAATPAAAVIATMAAAVYATGNVQQVSAPEVNDTEFDVNFSQL